MPPASPEIELRDAQPDDAPAIAALIASLLHYRSPVPAEPPSEVFLAQFRADVLAERIALPTYRYSVALDAGQVVGVIGVRDRSHLLHLFVAETHHRRGIARRLWERARVDILAAADAVPLTVRSSIYAVEVYRRFGFEPTGPRVDGPVTFVPMQTLLRR